MKPYRFQIFWTSFAERNARPTRPSGPANDLDVVDLVRRQNVCSRLLRVPRAEPAGPVPVTGHAVTGRTVGVDCRGLFSR